MSAHFVMLRSFNRRDTSSRRSAYPGYIWAVDGCAASAVACQWLSPLLALALSCGLRRVAYGPNGVSDRTEPAQEHCPEDTIVWLDPQSGLYQLKGRGPYGLYAYRGEAKRAGMHAMAN
jgi:hypothetical protein